MAEDMAPALIEAVKAAFTRLMAADSELAEKLAKIQAGSVSYTDALDYADRVGHALAKALGEELTADTLPDGTLYYNIAQRLITEVGGEACTLAASAAEMVQSELNHNADLDYLNPIKAKTTNERLTGLINTVSGKPITETASTLAAGARALPQGIVSDTMEANAEFQGQSGLAPKIVRKSAYKCCEWCSRVAGTYTYPVADRNVYRRHKNCRCTVEYVVGKKRTNVHTKQVTTQEVSDRIEAIVEAELRDKQSKEIQTRINKGEYSLQQSHQEYLKHVEGTAQYNQYLQSRQQKGKGPQGRLLVNEEEAQQLISRYSGKGVPKIRNGHVANVEYASAERTVGLVYNKEHGWIETRRFAIHHAKRGSHIVPVEEV